jgi:ATP-dependent DNA ligase
MKRGYRERRLIQPMLATLGKPPSRFTNFAVEAKDDRQRGLAICAGGAVTLLSRNGADAESPLRHIPSCRRCESARRQLEHVLGDDVALDF